MRFALSIDGAPVISEPDAERYLLVTGPGGNVQAHVGDLLNAVGRVLSPLEDDWIDLLTAIHVADLICQRGSNEDWNRSIRIGIPLRDPSPFHAVSPLLRLIFARLTHDAVDFEFERRRDLPARYPPGAPSTLAVDAVCLLSGGLDSAAAALNLARGGRSAVWVSARSSPHVRVAQREVVAEAGSGLSAAFGITVRHRHSAHPLPDIESSQRSRTLLYAGLAALVAASKGIAEIHLGENGVMAINCPLTAGRVGGFSTHTAHPGVLRLMERLFSEVFQTPMAITNPLETFTKTEVVARLADQAPELPMKTHSCWNTRIAEHCGTCVPCLVRRFSMISAGVPDRSYTTDVLNVDLPVGDSRRDNVVDYMVFARKFEQLGDDELLFEFNELNLPPPSDITAAIEMHRRWIRDVLSVARTSAQLSVLV